MSTYPAFNIVHVLNRENLTFLEKRYLIVISALPRHYVQKSRLNQFFTFDLELLWSNSKGSHDNFINSISWYTGQKVLRDERIKLPVSVLEVVLVRLLYRSNWRMITSIYSLLWTIKSVSQEGTSIGTPLRMRSMSLQDFFKVEVRAEGRRLCSWVSSESSQV